MNDLKREMPNRVIHWFIGMQITYFIMILAAVWFMVGHANHG